MRSSFAGKSLNLRRLYRIDENFQIGSCLSRCDTTVEPRNFCRYPQCWFLQSWWKSGRMWQFFFFGTGSCISLDRPQRWVMNISLILLYNSSYSDSGSLETTIVMQLPFVLWMKGFSISDNQVTSPFQCPQDSRPEIPFAKSLAIAFFVCHPCLPISARKRNKLKHSCRGESSKESPGMRLLATE